jgi:hypothetical protein
MKLTLCWLTFIIGVILMVFGAIWDGFYAGAFLFSGIGFSLFGLTGAIILTDFANKCPRCHEKNLFFNITCSSCGSKLTGEEK